MTVIQYAHIDYTRSPFHRWQWTFTQARTGILVQLLGILITIALNQLWILVQSFWLVHDRAQNPPIGAPGTSSTLSRKPRSLWEFIIDLLNQAHDELIPPVQLPGAAPKAHWSRILMKIWLVVIAFAMFVGILFLGVLAGTLQGDSNVLMTSAACGAYTLQGPFEPNPNKTLWISQAESEAQQYARLCYNGRKSDYGCGLFTHQAVSYTSAPNDNCPFRGGLCHLGPQGAITFSTGPTSASALGINAGSSLQFERSTTCAPITMNSTFIKHNQYYLQYTSDEKTLVDEFIYHYGFSVLMNNSDVTFKTRTSANVEDVWPTYSLEVRGMPGWLGDFHYNFTHLVPYGSDGDFPQLIAIPELRPPQGGLLLMLYVKSGKVHYYDRSDDPIFPATSRSKLQMAVGNAFEVWTYEGGHARVLGCVNYARWRDLADGQEWHEQHEPPAVSPESVDGKRWLLYLALQSSAISGIFDHATALNASSLLTTLGPTYASAVSRYASLAVDTRQWEVEARQRFETSLARAQFETKYMSLGDYANFPGWRRHSPWQFTPADDDSTRPMPPNTVTPPICYHNFVAKDPDFANINGIAYLMILIPCLAVILLSCPCGDSLLWEWLLGRKYANRVANAIVSASQACGMAAYLIVRISLDSLLWSLKQLWSMSCQKIWSVWIWTRVRRLAIYNGPPRGTAITDWTLDLLGARR